MCFIAESSNRLFLPWNKLAPTRSNRTDSPKSASISHAFETTDRPPSTRRTGMSPKPRYAGIALGGLVMLGAGILIGRGTNGKDPDAGTLTAGSAPAVSQSPAEPSGPDPAEDRLRRQQPPSRGGDDDRLQGEWGKDDDTRDGQEREMGTPIKRTKEAVPGGRSRPRRGDKDGPEDVPSEPQRRGGSDAVDA
jgi:hypothetical protein